MGLIPTGKILWRRNWQPTPVFLPEKSNEQRSLAGYGPWDCKVRKEPCMHHTHVCSSRGEQAGVFIIQTQVSLTCGDNLEVVNSWTFHAYLSPWLCSWSKTGKVPRDRDADTGEGYKQNINSIQSSAMLSKCLSWLWTIQGSILSSHLKQLCYPANENKCPPSGSPQESELG